MCCFLFFSFIIWLFPELAIPFYQMAFYFIARSHFVFHFISDFEIVWIFIWRCFFLSLLLFASVSIAFHRSIDVLLWLCLCVLLFKPKIWPHTNSSSISFSLLCIIIWLECNLLALIEFNTYSRKLAYVWDLIETIIRGIVATPSIWVCVCDIEFVKSLALRYVMIWLYAPETSKSHSLTCMLNNETEAYNVWR